MGLEIDFLAIGDSSQGGDAIALRYGNLWGSRAAQTVIIVDGGTAESGQTLVSHVREKFLTNFVDVVISTHPDADHVSGLHTVLDHLQVGQLAIHRPWRRPGDLLPSFTSNRITVGGIGRAISGAVSSARELARLAIRKGVNIIEPFAGMGTADGAVLVLGPNPNDYDSLACKFSEMPAARPRLSPIYEAFAGLTGTRPENDSSVVLLLTVEGRRVLLTADAGLPALHSAVSFARRSGIDLTDLNLFQVPHHGSRRNFDSSILDEIRAPLAVISAPANSEKHPASSVVDAIIMRGVTLYATRGISLLYSHNAPQRAGYGPVQPLSLSLIASLMTAAR